MRANGTIRLEMTSVSGGLPVIGGIITATATLDLSIDPETTITGRFVVDANLPNFQLANLTFQGRERDPDEGIDDRITVTEGFFQTEFACFNIFQRVGLQGPGIEFFRPLGVLKQGNEVFTMNSYGGTPPNIGFTFAGFDATPQSGSLTLDSGDLSGGICAGFSENPTPNDSFVTATFTGGGCVSLDGTDTEGVPFSLITTWDSWLDAGQPGTPSNECDTGTGGTGGAPTTPAEESPVSCFTGNDIIAIADAYITGDGPEPDRMLADTNFGTQGNLVIKSVPNLGFTRKIYMVFDLSSLPPDFSFEKASLVLTLERHVENVDPSKSGPQPVNVHGITDNNDWDPALALPDGPLETEITWNNAPRNNKSSSTEFLDQTGGVPRLSSGYDFDLPPVGEIDPGALSDPPVVTRYALDITDYVSGRLTNDTDKKITVLMVASNPNNLNQDGSTFFSREAPNECDRPFLHFEPPPQN